MTTLRVRLTPVLTLVVARMATDDVVGMTKLNLRANRIERIGGIGSCTRLQELELYENQISSIEVVNENGEAVLKFGSNQEDAD